MTSKKEKRRERMKTIDENEDKGEKDEIIKKEEGTRKN